MAKVTINEVEYESDNFNENQIKFLEEVVNIQRKISDIEYDKALYLSRNDIIIKALEESLDKDKEKPND